jgi:HPt (histidine-containing phosphotransfer) domain-containing protein
MGIVGHDAQTDLSSGARNLDQGVRIEAASVPAIDMRMIAQIVASDDLGENFVAEIIDVFLADLNQRIRGIDSQISNNDRAGIAATAHAIKGSCSHFGAARLMELLRKIEVLARREQADLQTAVASMIAEAERVRAALETYRSAHARL